jgi:predicted TIM-barrel enzyme
VLLPWASAIAGASELAHQRLTPAVLQTILEQVPDAWIASGSKTAEERRAQYLAYLSQRLAAAVNFEQEAIRAHQSDV